MNRWVTGSPDKTAYLLQCMQGDFDDGFLLLDTTGELAKEAAVRAPVEHTFYFDPSDIGHVAGLNVFDGVEVDDRPRVADELMVLIDLITETSSTLTRLRSNVLLYSALRLLLDAPDTTFLSVRKLLKDTPYRTSCLKHSADSLITDFWRKDFPTWKPEDRDGAILDVETRINKFIASPLVRNILCQPHSTFSLDGSHVVIVNLDRSKLGDQTALLLAYLVLSRAKGTIYISDLGFLASDHLAGLLAQDRFTVASRYLSELPPKLQQAVLGIEEKVVLQTTREDAERLAHYVGVSNPSVLTDLDPIEARTRTGVIVPTAPPPISRLRAIQKRSRACFTRPRAAVERETNSQLAPGVAV